MNRDKLILEPMTNEEYKRQKCSVKTIAKKKVDSIAKKGTITLKDIYKVYDNKQDNKDQDKRKKIALEMFADYLKESYTCDDVW